MPVAALNYSLGAITNMSVLCLKVKEKPSKQTNKTLSKTGRGERMASVPEQPDTETGTWGL